MMILALVDVVVFLHAREIVPTNNTNKRRPSDKKKHIKTHTKRVRREAAATNKRVPFGVQGQKTTYLAFCGAVGDLGSSHRSIGFLQHTTFTSMQGRHV
jgi:hypothetical protein